MQLFYIGASPRLLHTHRPHSHRHYELILNCQGTGTAKIGGRDYPFEPGTVHIVPPGTEHTKFSVGGFRDLYIETDAVQLEKNDVCAGPIVLHDDDGKSIEKLLSIMLARYTAGKRDEVIDELFRLVLRLIAERLRAGDGDPAVEAVKRRLRASFNDPELNVASVLASSGYAVDHMRRRFIRETRATPQQYVEGLRLDHARYLLSIRKSLSLTVADVGEMCGYYDQGYFSRVFKKSTGLSPTEYALLAEEQA